ncbi:hypothetical protein Tco_1439343 [Tanacetum coccineum]
MDKMQKSLSYLDHDKNHDLYDSLLKSIRLDEAIARGDLDPNKVRKRKRGDKDQDPPSDTTKEKKKKSSIDVELSKKSSAFKESSKGITPPKASKTDKSVHAEEIVKELAKEMAMDAEEPSFDDVQPPRLETPDPKWSKDRNVDVGNEQTWINDLEKSTKDLAEFNYLMDYTINFSNFIKHRLKKDKITKADIEGLVLKLLKGTCKSSIELEYHLEQRYLAFFDQMD